MAARVGVVERAREHLMARRTAPESGFAWGYRDLLTALLVAMIGWAVLSNDTPSEAKSTDAPSGALRIEMTWDDAVDADLDVHVKAPDDSPVYFIRHSGKDCDLVRDDLGHSQDAASKNLEIVFCRKTPEGEYTVNVQAYSSHDQHYPIHVKVRVWQTPERGASTEIAFAELDLDHDTQEKTALRFSLDANGKLVPGSVSRIPNDIMGDMGTTP